MAANKRASDSNQPQNCPARTVVATDLPHIFDCFTARQAPIFAENPCYPILYYALARLAAPEPGGEPGQPDPPDDDDAVAAQERERPS